MKRANIVETIVLAVLATIALASACTTPESPGPTTAVSLATTTTPVQPSATYTSTVKPSPTLPTATLTVEPSATRKPTPVDTPTPESKGPWAEGIDLQLVEGVFEEGSWSSTRDEIVYFRSDTLNMDTVLTRFAAPDFQPQDITAVVAYDEEGTGKCNYPNLLWSMDGQRIFFSGPASEVQDRLWDYCSIWMVEHDGRNPRMYQPEQLGRMLGLIGWLDDSTMVLSGYREGTSVVDLLTGNTVNWALPYGVGRRLFTSDYLVGTDGDMGLLWKMYALGRHNGALSIDNYWVEGNYFPYALTPPPDKTYGSWSGHSVLYDAVPNSNKVLGYWYSNVALFEGEEIIKTFYVRKLVLWDIDRNSLTTVVPYGVWGRFSPDQRSLAYMTYGPAPLDDKNQPVDPNGPAEMNLYDLDGENPFLQLLDRATNSVFLSVPVISLVDMDYSEYFYVGANFSPDGKLFAFLTDRHIAFDDEGWPEMVQTGETNKDGSHLYILDLENRRLIWDQGDLKRITGDLSDFEEAWKARHQLEERMPVWSPNSKFFISFDARDNAVLVDITTGEQTPITLNTSDLPRVQWSASGKYVAIQILNGLHWETGFLKIP